MLLGSQIHKTTEDSLQQRWQKTHKISFKSRAMKAFFFIYNNLSHCIHAFWDIGILLCIVKASVFLIKSVSCGFIHVFYSQSAKTFFSPTHVTSRTKKKKNVRKEGTAMVFFFVLLHLNLQKSNRDNTCTKVNKPPAELKVNEHINNQSLIIAITFQTWTLQVVAQISECSVQRV